MLSGEFELVDEQDSKEANEPPVEEARESPISSVAGSEEPAVEVEPGKRAEESQAVDEKTHEPDAGSCERSTSVDAPPAVQPMTTTKKGGSSKSARSIAKIAEPPQADSDTQGSLLTKTTGIVSQAISTSEQVILIFDLYFDTSSM